MENKDQNREFVFEIKEHLGVLSQSQRGWSKELNRVSFNGLPPRYDIRDWSPDHTKMSRGISFSEEELKELSALLDGMFSSSSQTAGALF